MWDKNNFKERLTLNLMEYIFKHITIIYLNLKFLNLISFLVLRRHFLLKFYTL